MFNKLKQIKDLRDQAKTMQSALASESITYEKNGISITMDGNMTVTNLTISDKSSSDLERNLISAYNESIKKAQQVMAKKMQEMGGLPNLTELLKG
ncbi:MAG TPA: YbaB/EbfC family nucleoid-associated protein [bacterium]|mgnify:FL=1|nr:YbaB/EbfC family nucleoid-associated protein [bacterium]